MEPAPPSSRDTLIVTIFMASMVVLALVLLAMR
jgi:hypothetical protein